MGGPKIEFVAGRYDAENSSSVPPTGRIPNVEVTADDIRENFGKKGFTEDIEIVALIGGGHALGKCHRNRSGYDGAWTDNPISFSN